MVGVGVGGYLGRQTGVYGDTCLVVSSFPRQGGEVRVQGGSIFRVRDISTTLNSWCRLCLVNPVANRVPSMVICKSTMMILHTGPLRILWPFFRTPFSPPRGFCHK